MKLDQASTKVFCKYVDFVDIFSPKLAAKFPRHIGINNYAIELVNNWQISYGLIYSLGLIELETLKKDIENNLVNSFIIPSKFFVGAPIAFNKKLNKSPRLSIDIWDLNNLTIYN